METWIVYSIKVNIALIFFYLLYVLLLKKDTFFQLRRVYFLSAIVFSFMYPFFAVMPLGNLIPLDFSPTKYAANVQVEYPVEMEVVQQVIVHEMPANASMDLNHIFVYAIISVSTVLFLRLIGQIISILHIWRRSRQTVLSNTKVRLLSTPIKPFSFFGWIFVDSEQHGEDELRQILLHEHIHTHQWHSVDVVLAELLCVFFWWNPIIWLMKREIAINLEYLADKGVLREGINSKQYQYYLLRLTYHESAVHIVNNFNVSQLKKRIMMMNKTKSPVQKLAKYVAILPLIALLITANSIYAANTEPQKTTENPQDKKKKSSSDEVFVVVQKQPEFQGGISAMMKFLSDNIRYPLEAQKNNRQGRVMVNFIVEKDGSISDTKIVKSVDSELDAEAIRVVGLMPAWKPGEQRGEQVRVRYTLPIVFRLQGENKAVATDNEKTGNASNEVVATSRKPSDSDEVFVVVEKQPEFPGGILAMMQFLSDNIRYPKDAQEGKIQGRVFCSFIINKDGSISDVNVMRSVDPSLDAEAIRVIGAMPNWKPGLQRGNPINVRYVLPITFQLQEDKKTENTATGIKEKEKDGKKCLSKVYFRQCKVSCYCAGKWHYGIGKSDI